MSIRIWRCSLIALAIVSGLSTIGVAKAEYPQPGALKDSVTSKSSTPVVIDQQGAGEGATDQLTSPAAPCDCCNSTCCTKKKKKAAAANMKGAFKGVFYANDFSYLDDPCYDGPSFCGDALKGLCSGRLDVGGELRLRYHNERNMRGLGLTGNDDNFWLTRYRMYADYQINDIFRFYGEYLYADSGGQTLASRSIEVNRGEAQNLFVDAKLLDDGCRKLVGRVGRQELLFGAQRLISPLDWANTRRTFDGGRLIYTRKDLSIDGFIVNPVRRTAAYADRWDATNNDIDFYGVYASQANTRFGTMDFYYMGLRNQALNFDYQTIGNRTYGTTDGGLLYDFENAIQFGDNSNGSDHIAGFCTAGLGRELSICTRRGEWNPTIWIWYDWASGEKDFADVGRGDDGFDHLFPLSHKYLGFMDLFGRRNINDANVQFITPMGGPRVKFLLWYHYFFLDQKTTPYNVNMTPFNTTAAAGDRELGQEIDLLFDVTLNSRNNVLFGYSHFDSGKYYSTTPGATNVDADFIYVQYQSRF